MTNNKDTADIEKCINNHKYQKVTGNRTRRK